jgi:MtN3 and saliva related transmembrane protein
VPALSPPVIEALGSGAALLTTLCWVPQAVRTIRTRDTRALSLANGWLIGSWPLILANAVSLALVFAILVMKLRHG